ncbi:MAG: DSD1 family PLP-dependent enzyme [Cyclobacteriaceae bacterium]|nr:DSD1 family PLP-dependent enzyme [Cyclobacteriaceae bacterium]
MKPSRRNFINTLLYSTAGVSLLGPAQTVLGKSKSNIKSSFIPESIWDIPTPALLIDRPRMESNSQKMQSFLAGTKAGLRPHTKTHKSPIIAKMQMKQGAVGICAAKVSEAEVMFESGLRDILITSPVVTEDKIKRVMALANQSEQVRLVVDREDNVADLNEAAKAAGINLSIMIELRMGWIRTGVEHGKPAWDLNKSIDQSSNLRFYGIQAYAGPVQHIKGFENRKRASEMVLAPAQQMKKELLGAGYQVEALSVGGTGTYSVDANLEGVTDIQAGSYLFMDVDYRIIGGEGQDLYTDFEPSLFVLSTAISQPMPGSITIDAGSKSFSKDKMPQLKDISGMEYSFAGDEHGILTFKDPSREIKVGDKVLLLTSHCDPTINLYDNYYIYNGEEVEGIWPVAGRGKSQ